MTSTETDIFLMDEDGASKRRAWTTIYEDEPRRPCEKVMWKALEVNKMESQSRPRQFERTCEEGYKRKTSHIILLTHHHQLSLLSLALSSLLAHKEEKTRVWEKKALGFLLPSVSLLETRVYSYSLAHLCLGFFIVGPLHSSPSARRQSFSTQRTCL